MRTLVLGLLAAGLLAVAAFSGMGKPVVERGGDGLAIQREARNPWTGAALNNDPADFQFAIVSDRTGGHRPRIFSQAVERLNWLQPEFVLSVGDLIEGGTKTKEQLAGEWKEFDGYVQRLQMPFFYVPGNHDVGTRTGEEVWDARLGRRHYHFVYRNVLFLCLNTDDPPGSGAGHLGKEQVAFVRQVLAANPSVRWTIVAMHKPVWTSTNLEATGWLEVEQALADRPYTVFVGHVHRYQKFVRNGRAYYQLATTGGSSKLRGVGRGEFDQIVWVTMKKDGPVLANILVDAILPEDLQTPESAEAGVSTANRKPTYPVRGRVFHGGVAVPQAYVTFQSVEGTGRAVVRADGLTEADGSFTLSTYTAHDGAPAGEYFVTVVQRKPFMTPDGKPGPNLLPARYARPETSGLRAAVQKGPNDVILELQP